MKKTALALILALVLALSLAACGGGASSSAPASVSVADSSSEAASVASSVPAASSEAEEELFSQDFDITNSTGVNIVELYISPSDEEVWGEEQLGGEAFAHGETIHYSTDLLGTADATWDILVVDEDGDEITFSDLNLSSITALNLHWGEDGQTPTAEITRAGEEEYFSQDVNITNDTGVDIVELYISPSDDDMWGEDLLAGETFAAGETVRFTPDLVGTADATWDICIVDADGDEVVFEGVNLSTSTNLSLHWGQDGKSPTVTMA